MSDIFYFILFVGLSVGVYLSQDVRKQHSEYQIVKENSEVDSYEDYEDYQKQQTEDVCYSEKVQCLKNMGFRMPKPICVYKKRFGLTNYLGLCEISLQNCLTRVQKKTKGSDAFIEDEIYHNGKTFDCHYYVLYAKTEKEAITWYFKLGGLDAENENITASIDTEV